MRLDSERESSNLEDRRGGGGVAAKGGLGIGAIIIAVIAMYFGVDPQTALNVAQNVAPATQSASPARPGGRDELSVFTAKVLANTEDAWDGIFRQAGAAYRKPKLVLFSGTTPTACGTGQSAMGPFYCPGDEKVYLDLDFYRDLRNRYGAPGDFAQAYVIAHEIGHHVQQILGISQKVDALRQKMTKTEYNKVLVRLELQADCFAGVWAHHAQRRKQILEPGDIEEGLRAAAAIGDDRLQQQSQGVVVPESFTHGTSEQRMRWLKTGIEQGSIKACDTFAARSL